MSNNTSKEVSSGSGASRKFEQYYTNHEAGWGGNSGPGSNAFYTIEYRAFLDKFISMNLVNTVVDIGCGDWQFSRFINYDNTRYLGFDIVPSVIEKNRALYASPTISFHLMPDDLNRIPPGDLLVKDVLQHLSDADILKFKDKLFGRFKHVLLTNSYQKLDTPQNLDIESGSFRCLDLAAPPFSFRGAYVLEFGSAVWERIRTFQYVHG